MGHDGSGERVQYTNCLILALSFKPKSEITSTDFDTEPEQPDYQQTVLKTFKSGVTNQISCRMLEGPKNSRVADTSMLVS